MNWFKFYGQDWLTDIKILQLSIEDRLCYLTLLCLASASDNPGQIKKCDEEAIIELSHIPFDPCDTDNPFERAKGFLKRLNDNGMITIDDNGDVTVKNFIKRQGQSLTGYERVKKYREKQKKIKPNRYQDNVNDNADDNSRIEESRVDKNIIPPNPLKGDCMGDSEFQEFWKIYPHKIAKAAARKKFLKLHKSKLPDILQAVEKQKKTEQWQREEGRFIPYPATWLNQERWNDEVKEGTPKLKPYYDGFPMIQQNGRWKVIKGGEWLEFNDKESKIVWK